MQFAKLHVTLVRPSALVHTFHACLLHPCGILCIVSASQASMSMRLCVELQEARNLKPSSRPWQAYAELKLGNTKHKSALSPSGSPHPYWFKEFLFDVDDTGSVVNIVIWGQDRLSKVFLGRVYLPVADILKAEKQASWYSLEKRHSKSKTPITGEVLVKCSLSFGDPSSPRSFSGRHLSDSGSASSSVTSTPEHSHFRSRLAHSASAADQGDESSKKSSSSSSASFLYVFLAWLSSLLTWLLPRALTEWLSTHVPWLNSLAKKNEGDAAETVETEDAFIEDEGLIFPSFFEDDGVATPSSEEEMPAPLKGGVLLSGTYNMSAKALNGILFGPECQFLKDLTALQKTTDLVEGPWTRGDNDLPRRVVKYVKAPTKLVSAVKASEEQVYLRADDKGFVVNAAASTPDVVYGSTFRVNVQYCIFSGSQASTGEKACFLRISWGVHFLTSTMMKNLIEKGARQGLQESYKQYAQILEKYAKPQQDSLSAEGEARNFELPLQERDGDVASTESKSTWQLAREYFSSLKVCITLFFLVIVLAHIYSSKSDTKSSFEIWRMDLPDSLCELILAALLGAQIQSILGKLF